MDRTGLGSCPVAGFGGSGIERGSEIATMCYIDPI